MAGYIARQPNGLLCRHSTVTDCITDYNMTDEEYIKLCREKAADEAKEVLKNYVRPFSNIKQDFTPNNMSRKQFNQILKEMEQPAEDCKYTQT